MRSCLALLLAVSITSPLSGEVLPVASSGDPRIQEVVYDPDEVVALSFSSGFSLTIQFSPDEQIETVIIGDSGSWTAQPSRRADHLVLMPKGMPPPSNMTVLTDQRTYNFILYASATEPGVSPYLVRFTYPTTTDAQPREPVRAGRYTLRGNKRLWPLELIDDGMVTSIRWANELTLPAVYSENDRGELALVNGVMRDQIYVLDAVYPKLVFIRGKLRAQAVRVEVGDE